MEWTHEKKLTFIEHYQEEPVIWDPKNPLHKDKKAINDAWIRLMTVMEVPVVELKKKKESLMSSFRFYLRKKKASFRSGAGAEDVYTPIWFAYSAMEQFLSPVYECSETKNSEEGNWSLNNEGANLDESDVTPSTSIDEPFSWLIDESDVTPSTSIDEPFSTANSTSRKTTKRMSPSQIENEIGETFTTLKRVLDSSNTVEDDCDLYAKLLASKLRQYSLHARQRLMYEIDGILLRNQPETSPYYSAHSPQHLTSPYSSTPPPTQITPSQLKPSSMPSPISMQIKPNQRRRIPPEHTIEILSETIIPSQYETVKNVIQRPQSIVQEAYETAFFCEDTAQSPK